MSSTTGNEKPLRSDLLNLFKKAKLPTSPVLAAQILELTNNPKATVEQFAALIQMDAVLSAKLLRMANSAEFAQRKTVASIPRAVTVLGINRVRTVALGFQLVGHLDRLGECPFDLRRFWRNSLLRGCLAREIMKLVMEDLADEAFLCGLLQDCGIQMLVQLLGPPYAQLYETGNRTPSAFFDAERAQFPYHHVDAVRVMAEEWQLPRQIAIPLSRHHTSDEGPADSPEIDPLCRVSFLVGSLSLSRDEQAAASEPTLAEFARDRLNLDEAALRSCIDKAGAAFSSVATVLRDSLPSSLDVTDLLSEANRKLTRAAGQAEMLAIQAREESAQAQAAQATLRNELGEIRERASHDPLTGLLNRGALVESARQIATGAARNGQGIGVHFLDIDNFKKLNDQFGHAAGDAVLKGVAAALNAIIGSDGCAGRYGGEEFVAVRPAASEADVASLAARIVAAVRETRFPDLALPGPVTCSLGAVWTPAASPDGLENLFQLADGLMYRAKRGGKNRCCVAAKSALDAEPQESADKGTHEAITRELGPAQATRLPERVDVPAQLRIIAQELNRNTPPDVLNLRKQVRKELITPCRLRFLSPDRSRLLEGTAYVRNISTGGIGFLATRAFEPSTPIETTVISRGRPLLYAAGLVRFCKRVTGNVHDVGVQFFAHDRKPLFPDAPAEILARYPWARDAQG